MTFDRDTAVEELLRQEFRKFRPLPDVVHQGLSAAALPPDVIPTGIGGAEMTVSIAASNASDRSKEKADFVAVATTDDRIIHEAALDSIDWNGKLLLSEGSHVFDSGLLRASGGGNVLYEGMGAAQTTITSTTTMGYLFNSTTAIDWAWKDLTLNGGDVVTNSLNWGLAAQGSYKMHRVTVRDFTSHGVDLNRAAGEGRFVDCLFTSNTGRGFLHRESNCAFFYCQFTLNGSDGLRCDQSDNDQIFGNLFRANGGDGYHTGNALVGGATAMYLVGNVFVNNVWGIGIADGNNHHIVGNYFTGNSSGSMTFGAGGFGHSEGTWIDGNRSNDATWVVHDVGEPQFYGTNLVNGTVEIGDGIPVTPHPARVQVTYASKDGILATGFGTLKIPWTVAGSIVDVTLAMGTSPIGQDLIVDLHKNGGASIFTVQADRPRVLDGDADGIGAAAQPQVNAMAVGDYLIIDIDQVGSPSTEGADLVVAIEWIAD